MIQSNTAACQTACCCIICIVPECKSQRHATEVTWHLCDRLSLPKVFADCESLVGGANWETSDSSNRDSPVHIRSDHAVDHTCNLCHEKSAWNVLYLPGSSSQWFPPVSWSCAYVFQHHIRGTSKKCTRSVSSQCNMVFISQLRIPWDSTTKSSA